MSSSKLNVVVANPPCWSSGYVELVRRQLGIIKEQLCLDFNVFDFKNNHYTRGVGNLELNYSGSDHSAVDDLRSGSFIVIDSFVSGIVSRNLVGLEKVLPEDGVVFIPDRTDRIVLPYSNLPKNVAENRWICSSELATSERAFYLPFSKNDLSEVDFGRIFVGTKAILAGGGGFLEKIATERRKKGSSERRISLSSNEQKYRASILEKRAHLESPDIVLDLESASRQHLLGILPRVD